MYTKIVTTWRTRHVSDRRSLRAAIGAGWLLGAALVAVGPGTAVGQEATPKPPRLILQITVDQLRGDLPLRHRGQLGEGGLGWLVGQGVHYANAHYRHANTETIVGHVDPGHRRPARPPTGWWPTSGSTVSSAAWLYNIEDGRYDLLTVGADVDAATEIDPTQKAAKVDGRSPAALAVSTFSDELAILTGGRSKVFAVSVKDRGAVSMAGHVGKGLLVLQGFGSVRHQRATTWIATPSG